MRTMAEQAQKVGVCLNRIAKLICDRLLTIRGVTYKKISDINKRGWKQLVVGDKFFDDIFKVKFTLFQRFYNYKI